MDKVINSDSILINLDIFQSLVVATVVLLLGRLLVYKFTILKTYTIPEPVIGGIVVAMLVTLLRMFNIEINFDTSLQTPLMLCFFASIGMSAKFSTLIKGGPILLKFLFVVVGLLFAQNILGAILASTFGLDSLIGLLTGSITLSGGHGTGAAWAGVFEQEHGVALSTEITLASATFGLIAGGLLGGPIVKFLLNKITIQEISANKYESQNNIEDQGGFEHPEDKEATNANNFINTVAMFAIAITVGVFLSSTNMNKILGMPTFVYTLFTGVIITNILPLIDKLFPTVKIAAEEKPVTLIGNVSLSLFLAFALMSLKLWQLYSLALPLFVILIAQTILMAAYAVFVTFKIMGSNYDAIIIAAGHCGFGMGATPTAVANMQSATNVHGPSHLAFLIVPLTGAFLIDIINAITINFFVYCLS